VCDLETSRIGAAYIYNVRLLRVNTLCHHINDYFHILKLYLSMDKWKINEWKWKFESHKMSVPAPSPTWSIIYHIIQIASDRVRTRAHENNKMDMTDCLSSFS